MLRQAAFIAKNKMLKGALHCHTTRSDGKGDPGDVMRMHKEHGYDFISITDHRNYNFKSFAPETGLTVVPGMEMDGILPRVAGVHCYHVVCIGPEKDKGNGFEQDQYFENLHVTCAEEFQPTLDYMHANGNLTIYCHPQWSQTPVREFEDLKGNIAMEIWNSGCAIEDDIDYDNGFMWDELLRKGKKIWGVATDDGHPVDQHCHGWVMVNSKNDVGSILQALKDGAFYASTGPEIYDFRIENGKIIVDCSECDHITYYFGRRSGGKTQAEPGKTVTHGERDLIADMPYVRVSVVDKQGMRAWTNPIFLDRNMERHTQAENK